MHEELIRAWMAQDPMRMRALHLARELDLPDWCLAAGFVRNLVWDKLHGFEIPTPLDDIDLVYFDPLHAHREHDRRIEQKLVEAEPGLPWAVRNQARMHDRNGDAPYQSTLDAMSFWVEQETAVGVRLDGSGCIEVVSAFGLDGLFAKRITPNRRKRNSATEFSARLARKNWLWRWPDLRVDAQAS
jgi:uncharacterized protein